MVTFLSPLGVYHPNFFPFRDALEVSWRGDLCGQRVSGSESDGGGLVMVGGFAQNLRWLVVELPIQGSKGAGFCGFWDQILRGNGWCFFLFEVELNVSGQPPGLVEKTVERPGR